MDEKRINKQSDVIRVTEFLILTFGLPALCLLLFQMNESATFHFIVYGIEGASPMIAAIMIVLIHEKSEGLKKFLRDKYISNVSLAKCALAFLVPFVILTVAKLVAVWMGDLFAYPIFPTAGKMLIIAWALIAEELGWRGYLQDELERILPHCLIPLLTGVLWALWHYHFVLSGSMDIPIVAFALGCIFESYGYFAITKMAKNNILPASIWHFTGNLIFHIYRFDPQWHNGDTTFYWIATVCYGANIILFILYEKKETRNELAK